MLPRAPSILGKTSDESCHDFSLRQSQSVGAMYEGQHLLGQCLLGQSLFGQFLLGQLSWGTIDLGDIDLCNIGLVNIGWATSVCEHQLR